MEEDLMKDFGKIEEHHLIEQLLKPRYLHKADFPGQKNNIGHIYFAGKLGADWFKRYPAIFKELQWYEKIKESQFPKHIKFTIGSRTIVHRVKSVSIINDIISFKSTDENCPMSIRLTSKCLPATASEYLNYIQQP